MTAECAASNGHLSFENKEQVKLAYLYLLLVSVSAVYAIWRQVITLHRDKFVDKRLFSER